MRQNNVDFQNRELPTNILARLLVTTRDVTTDDTPRVLRHCDFPDSSARRELQRHQEQTVIAPLNECDRLAATLEMAA